MKNLKTFFVLFITVLMIVSIADASSRTYTKGALVGGTSGCLDQIDGDDVVDGDRALVVMENGYYIYRLNASSGESENSPFIISPDVNAGTKRWIWIGSDQINVKLFGAKGDGETDDLEAFQSATNAALAGDIKTIYIPDGTYNLGTSLGGYIDPGNGGIAFKGQSEEGTIILFNEGTDADPRYVFYNNDISTKEAVTFENFTIKGTLTTTNGQYGGNAIQIDYYPRLTFHNITFKNLRHMATSCHYSDNVQMNNCSFYDISADGARFRDCRFVKISDCHFERLGDDSIALHINDNTVPKGGTGTIFDPIRDSLIVTNNTLVNCGMIKILGGRNVIITNNHLKLINGPQTIRIGRSTTVSEGNIAIYNLEISGNIITDSFNENNGTFEATIYTISIASYDLAGATITDNTPIEEYNSVTGKFIYPWDWNDSLTNNTDYPVGPSYGIYIHSNIIGRTLPIVSNFTDYGFGMSIKNGEYVDGEITDTTLRSGIGISLGSGGFNSVQIYHNNVTHVGTGVIFTIPLTDNYYKSIKIDNNIFRDIINRGIYIPANDTNQQVLSDTVISDNIFNMDPYRLSSNSNIDGTYDEVYSLPEAITVTYNVGVTITNNLFKNTCIPIRSQNTDLLNIFGNTLVAGTPVAVGFNVGNTGIGYIQPNLGNDKFIEIDADPTSATYEKIINVHKYFGTAAPTSGWYWAGEKIWDSSPEHLGKAGWVCTATGSPGTWYAFGTID